MDSLKTQLALITNKCWMCSADLHSHHHKLSARKTKQLLGMTPIRRKHDPLVFWS
ncbi:hypothetical protein O9992_02400 [Vibrio lentus]|nr:hypothetical protein [Vibrio lentus]